MNAPPFRGGERLDDGLVNAEASATGRDGSRNHEDGMGIGHGFDVARVNPPARRQTCIA